jgi:hypothetical protein
LKVEFGNSWTLPLAFVHALSLKSVTVRLLPRVPFFLVTRTLLAHVFRNISNHCRRIHSALSMFFYRQPLLESLQKICNRYLPVQGSISLLFQTVLSHDSGPIVLLEKPSHPYFLPLVECTKVWLPDPFGKLLQGEFHFLQAS